MSSRTIGDVTVDSDHWVSVDDAGSCFYRLARAGDAPPAEPLRIAGFDFDDTLVDKKNPFAWSFPSVVERLRALHEQGFRIVVFSNENIEYLKKSEQKSKQLNRKLLKMDEFMDKVGVPADAFVATRYDLYRKPCSKDLKTKQNCGGNLMWTTFLGLIGSDESGVNKTDSFYVGDSDGQAGSFSDGDKLFALNVMGVPFKKAKTFFAKPSEAKASSSSITTSAATVATIQKTVEVVDLEQSATVVVAATRATATTTTTTTTTATESEPNAKRAKLE